MSEGRKEAVIFSKCCMDQYFNLYGIHKNFKNVKTFTEKNICKPQEHCVRYLASHINHQNNYILLRKDKPNYM